MGGGNTGPGGSSLPDAQGHTAHGIKTEGEALLIPLRDTTGTLHSLQAIGPEGDKRFQPGGRIKGCYFGIGKPAGVLVIAEGVATGASIHEATGHAVACAMNAGNGLHAPLVGAALGLGHSLGVLAAPGL